MNTYLRAEESQACECGSGGNAPHESEEHVEEGLVAEEPASERNRSDVVEPSEWIPRHDELVQVLEVEPRCVRRADCGPEGEHDEVALQVL